MTSLKKEDWIKLKQSAEEQLKQLEISSIQFTTLLDISEKKIAEYEALEEKEIEDFVNED